MQKENFTVESDSLSDLLTSAKKLILKKGSKSVSQRGVTYSLNKVLLVWQNPVLKKGRYSFRPKQEDEWYQNIFVRKSKNNLPERLPKKTEFIFPYKYAHRGRYYDSGWGYVSAVCEVISQTSANQLVYLKNFQNFCELLEILSESAHLQTVLSVLTWFNNSKNLNYWLKNKAVIQELIANTRIDPLQKTIREVVQTPETRRAITPSFMYGLDYLLDPMMGVPPYQNFQLLPNKQEESLSSLHYHRSLDTSGGAQLDFNHDFDWLSLACSKTKRKMGSISVLAGNLHLYTPEETNNVRDWLMRVTDGYKTGNKSASDLLKKNVYIKNARKVYSLLTK